MPIQVELNAEESLMTSQRPKKILIVEDEREIAQLIKHYLEKEGYHSCIADTGIEAQNIVSSEHPDLVILDLMLPQLDGLEVCKTCGASQRPRCSPSSC